MIRRFEQRSRREYITPQGTEIVRKFFLDPYVDHPIVMSALLGGVDQVDALFVRRKPNQDPYYKYCYCNHAEVELVDDRQCCGDESVGFKAVESPQQLEDDFLKVQTALNNKERMPGAHDLTQVSPYETETGCWITARYKPLVRVEGYVQGGISSTHEVPEDKVLHVVDDKTQNDEIDAFDVLDPIITPIARFISIPRGLYFVVKDIAYFELLQEAIATQAFATFTIRRHMVPKVPSVTISKLQGKVNSEEAKFGDLVFPKETLRFMGCDTQKIVVPNKDGGANVFYDLLYKFDVNWTYDLLDNELSQTKPALIPGYVGWNRALACYKAFTSLAAEKLPLAYYRIGYKHSAWQNKFNLTGDVNMQFPAADGDDVYPMGFLQLFEWDAE